MRDAALIPSLRTGVGAKPSLVKKSHFPPPRACGRAVGRSRRQSVTRTRRAAGQGARRLSAWRPARSQRAAHTSAQQPPTRHTQDLPELHT
eukprot:scaffold21194_cov68-Phaeocystis_antarctica.AAC.3